ncbi:carboxylesterase family protein [Kribbella sp. NBC_01245]|uniref:carboxylesterase/lipase family protein n=1 Tax=Kribbella sp. NBC_01245 TaxID=2903578 RepID=UPI002E283E27|nr:carboxylesterase family protein [Kribbella sp. NBC_01245]
MRKLLVCMTAGAAVLTAAVATQLPATAADESVVRTTYGTVRGTLNPDSRVFLGVPFAAPPTGDFRWRAPRPPASWSGVRDATQVSEQCLQVGWPGEPPPGSEDCLYLNVWTPRQTTSPKPVMVFLHGGGFITGSGRFYDPTRLLAQDDVLFVSVNYRLGALGYLKHPSLKDPYAGNFGLADQQAALRWVRANIASFGGDPHNVTLWGESAGAFSTCAQLAAPGARGLFDKAIVQSGPCANNLVTKSVAEQRALKAATTVGCPDARTAVACLRAKPAAAFAALDEERVGLVRRSDQLPWMPVTGTPALPLQPLAAMRHGLAADVPIILGGTKDEMRGFVSNLLPITPEEYPGEIRRLFGDDAPAVLKAYPASRYDSPAVALATAMTDEGKMLGACAQLPVAKAARGPVYLYEFAEDSGRMIGDYPLGAYHGSDVPYFFGSSYRPGPGSPPPLTERQKVLADKLSGYWTTFARTGVPGSEWSAVRDGTALSVTVDKVAQISLAAEHNCRFWKAVG